MSTWQEEWDARKRAELLVRGPEVSRPNEYGGRVVTAYRVTCEAGKPVITTAQITLGGCSAGTYCYPAWAGCNLSAVGEGWRASRAEALATELAHARARLAVEERWIKRLEEKVQRGPGKRSSSRPRKPKARARKTS